MHRPPASLAISVTRLQDERNRHLRACRFLASAHPLEPIPNRRTGRDALKFAAQEFLHGLTSLGGAHGKLIPYVLGHPSNCDLHGHESTLPAMKAYCKHSTPQTSVDVHPDRTTDLPTAAALGWRKGGKTDRRWSETPPSVQYAGRLLRQTIYRESGLAAANYPAYPTAVPL